MPGITKRKYIGELMRFNKQLKRPLNYVKSILPREYSADLILSEFKKYYPLLWKEMSERHEQYQAKDQFLTKIGKPARYKPLKPELYFFDLPQIKLWLSAGYKAKHREQFDEKKKLENVKLLTNKGKSSMIKFEDKIRQNTEGIQYVEPLYIDAYIAAYHRKGINTEGKIEIFKELKKYHNHKTTKFFYKLNDCERNCQIRRMAFEHLQSIGKYVKLRKNFKGKKKDYMVERSDFNMTPVDLWNRIDSNKIQNKKHFNFFISHSLLDRHNVLKVIKSLNNYSYNAYCDWTSDNDFLKRDLVSDYTKMILMKRIDQSDSALFIKSNNSLSSKWVAFELDYCQRKSKKIFYVELDESDDHRLSDFTRLEFEMETCSFKDPIIQIPPLSRKANRK